MTVSIRSAKPSDEDAVVALWHRVDLVAAYNDPAEDFRFARNGLASDVLIAEDEETIVGSVTVGHDGHRGWLYYVASAPEHRGEGIGARLVDAAEGWLRERGVAKVHLMVRETNTEVVGFYRTMGFEPMPRVLMSRWLNGKPDDA